MGQDLKVIKQLTSILFLFFALVPLTAQTDWQQTNGPQGGSVRDMVVDKSGHIFAATAAGGVFRSTDGGATWNDENKGMDGFVTTSLALSPGGKLYAGLFGAINRIYPGGLYEWNPANSSWSKILNYEFINDVLATSETDIYAATPSTGLYFSEDGGSEWNLIGDTLLNIDSRTLAVHPVSGNIYVGTFAKGIYIYDVKTKEWSIANNGLGNLFINSLIISESYVYAGTNGGVYRSDDNGANWTQPDLGTLKAVNGLAFTPDRSAILAGTSFTGVNISKDNGQTWIPISLNLPEVSANNYEPVYPVMAVSNTEFLCGSNSNGIYRSQDEGSSWQMANTGLIATRLSSFAITGTGDILAASLLKGVARSANRGDVWLDSSEGLLTKSLNVLHISAKGDVYAGTNGAHVYKSGDNGLTWTAAGTGIDNRNIHSFTEDALGNIFAGGFLGDIFKSDNAGTSWTKLTRPASGTVADLAMDSNGNLYATILNGGIHRSGDQGVSWTDVTPSDSGVAITKYIQSLFIDDNQVIYAGGIEGYFFYSTDKGDSWVERSVGETKSLIYTVLAGDNGQIMVGTQLDGIFVTADSGNTWQESNDGLKLTRVRDIIVHPDGYIMLGSLGSGVYERQNTISSIAPAANLLSGYSLRPNYPNPFNPATTIEYTLGEPGRIRLSVFNNLGQRVATLKSGEQPAGSYSITFDAFDLASGIYFYRLEAGKFTKTRKMILLR